MQLFTSPRGQAMPGPTRPLTSADFGPRPDTAVTWLGSAGIFLNSRGSTLMVDPLLQDFDMPLLIQPPIRPRQVPRLDALLITHIDNDHFSRSGCLDMKDACRSYHAPRYVAEQIAALGLPGNGHDIGETFQAGCISATLTPARHNWQNGSQKWSYRHWEENDYCGYWFDTPDGSIWLPVDSQLLPSHQTMPQPDLILLDFSDNEWHITFEGAVRLANAYPQARLLCIHWGSVDAPDWSTFNGDPAALAARVSHPERVLAPRPRRERAAVTALRPIHNSSMSRILQGCGFSALQKENTSNPTIQRVSRGAPQAQNPNFFPIGEGFGFFIFFGELNHGAASYPKPHQKVGRARR